MFLYTCCLPAGYREGSGLPSARTPPGSPLRATPHIGRFLPKPDSCRPPWEVRTDCRAHLQGVLGLLWRVSSAESPGSYPVTCASAAPPNRRSIESSFGIASSLLPPHSWEREYVDHSFPGGGKCVLAGKRRNFHRGFLEWCCSCPHLHLGSRLLPWAVCISA